METKTSPLMTDNVGGGSGFFLLGSGDVPRPALGESREGVDVDDCVSIESGTMLTFKTLAGFCLPPPGDFSATGVSRLMVGGGGVGVGAAFELESGEITTFKIFCGTARLGALSFRGSVGAERFCCSELISVCSFLVITAQIEALSSRKEKIAESQSR
mmetsp:Transcript_32566/g.81612  ORF Transcript_32566/g.81612 Transcript_32566/m.81612 type:complete len:158 (-) Transcript_32566:214-687(-)